MKTESVIDFPKNSLCPDVWEKVVAADGMSEVWQLKRDVKDKVLKVWKHVCPNAKVVHITGSITSNSYTENADIDVHFLDADVTFNDNMQLEQFQKEVRDRYQKTYIGKHLIEVYYQDNVFQDYMSVGCYDVLNGEWLVGPEFTDQSFNPYSEYYKEVLAQSESLAKQIRNMIFSIYEIAVVMKKNIGTEFQQNVRQILMSRLEEVKKLYDSIRQMRKVYSSPTTAEEALRWRNSRKWKVADASFKLFDKYGYMAILKQFIQDAELMSSTNDVDAEAVEDILNTVKNYINNADKLAEKELFEDEQLEEGTISNMLIASLLAIPGILPQDALAKQLVSIPKNQLHMTSQPVQAAIDKATVDTTMVGRFSYRNSVNILQWVHYTEAANQELEGRKAIMSVIWNRAGGDPNKLLEVVLKSGTNKNGKRIWQFSEWQPGNPWKLVAPTSDKDWTYKVPKDITNPKVQKIWKEGEKFAKLLLAGRWKSNIGKCNLIASDRDSDVAKSTWGKDCNYKIGDHRFGYDPSQDGFKKSGKTYVVTKGDTGYQIAANNNMQFSKLKQLNPNVDWNKLQIGQKLKLP